MRRFVLVSLVAFLGAVGLSGCGGHEGGVIDVPLEENPYQITDSEQEAMNTGLLKETEDLAEARTGVEATK